ncbi:hypothetical protein EGW08_023757, partial [Elysia chlorotica]
MIDIQSSSKLIHCIKGCTQPQLYSGRTSFVEKNVVGWLVDWVFNVQHQQLIGYLVDGPQDGRLTILCAATHETGWGYHDSCLSRSHYTDTDPTSRDCSSQDSNSGPFASEADVLPHGP